MNRLLNIVFSLDCFLFSLFTLGAAYPFESFSSAAYRARLLSKFYGRALPLIDWVLGDGHCERAYYSAKLNLPPDQN